MKDIMTWALEGLKTAGRYFIIAAAPVALDAAIQGVQLLSSGVVTLKLTPQELWLLRLALAGADSMLHQWKKNTESEGSWKGIIGF